MLYEIVYHFFYYNETAKTTAHCGLKQVLFTLCSFFGDYFHTFGLVVSFYSRGEDGDWGEWLTTAGPMFTITRGDVNQGDKEAHWRVFNGLWSNSGALCAADEESTSGFGNTAGGILCCSCSQHGICWQREKYIDIGLPYSVADETDNIK